MLTTSTERYPASVAKRVDGEKICEVLEGKVSQQQGSLHTTVDKIVAVNVPENSEVPQISAYGLQHIHNDTRLLVCNSEVARSTT